MYGNVLTLDYDYFSVLATNGTWFKNVWELLHEFNTSATFGTKMQIQPVQEGVKSLMTKFSKYYSGRDLQVLNIYRQYKKVIHLSCIVLSDGPSINKECMSTTEGRSDLHKFPLQHPSCSDQTLWISAFKRISSEYLLLSEPLGPYIRPPHERKKWTTAEDGTIVHFEVTLNGKSRYIVYQLSSDIETRLGQRMTQMEDFTLSPLPFYASTI